MNKCVVGFFLIIPLFFFGQKTDTISWIAIYPHIGFQLPGGDLSKRFGENQEAGAGVQWKFKKNFFLQIEGSYIFGGKVKIKDSLFKDISTQDGYIIDANGQFAEVYTYERGYYITVDAGKILTLKRSNSYNSGIIAGVGTGFLQHKIRIYNPDNTAPQVIGDYAKGYDFLTNGIVFKQFVGYSFYKLKRAFNFRLEFEILEGITRGRRDYLFPLKGPDPKKHLDLLFGIKFKYYFPIEIKNKSTTYFF